MPQVMLGDNPFFAISHLSPSKSEEYLGNTDRWSNAVEIIRASPNLGIGSFMISSHAGTISLLEAAGYPEQEGLPDICLVVPNVHDLNSKAASGGLVGSLLDLFRSNALRQMLSPRRAFQRAIMSNIGYPQVKYLALHNVVVDLLLGLGAIHMLKLFCFTARFFGYKPVLITLNPQALLNEGIKCHAICCYYNEKRYNVADDPETTLAAFDRNSNVEEIWAMGVVASGVVPYDNLGRDRNLQHFTRVLVASSKLDRIKEMSAKINNV